MGVNRKVSVSYMKIEGDTTRDTPIMEMFSTIAEMETATDPRPKIPRPKIPPTGITPTKFRPKFPTEKFPDRNSPDRDT